MHLFMAAMSGPRITLAEASPTHSVTDPTDASAGYRLEGDGDIMLLQGPITDAGDWITPKVASSWGVWEVRATEVSGTVSTGTVDTWLALSSNPEWTVARTAPGDKVCTLTIEIRRASNEVVMGSCNVTMTASVAGP